MSRLWLLCAKVVVTLLWEQFRSSPALIHDRVCVCGGGAPSLLIHTHTCRQSGRFRVKGFHFVR